MSSAKPAQKRDIQWADVCPPQLSQPLFLPSLNLRQGLRGIACFLVVLAHGFQGFGMPETSFAVPFPFALPFFRLILHGGFLSVAIFFVMSGYVCSIKPLKLARAGKAQEARNVIASSAFRRVIRLAIPATIATTIGWFLCQIGAYDKAHTLSQYCWLNFHSAWASPDWITSVKDLLKALVTNLLVFFANVSFIPGPTMEKFGLRTEIGMK